MPALLLFLAYLIFALVLAALLFLPLYQILDAIWEVRPDRVFFRLAMLIAILGFWPFLKLVGLNNRVALGYTLSRRDFLLSITRGLGIGVMIMALHTLLLILSGARVPTTDDIQISSLVNTAFSGPLAG